MDLFGWSTVRRSAWHSTYSPHSKVSLKFFEYSNSKEYLAKPDVVDYDNMKMTKSVYDLILGCKTTKELGIVLNF